MPQAEAAGAVSSVWAKTVASYKKDLSRKDLLVVESYTSPKNIADHIKSLEAKTHAGKSGAFADRVHAVTGRLTQFSSVIGIITSSNTEASLIWGSLKLLLTIVHQSSEEYEKICRSILAVSDSFPIVELVVETFNHSELVCTQVVAFYSSVLSFWSKALKFYKRRRVFNLFRAWHDFDSEFGDLDRDMKRYGKMIEKAAAAVHMDEARTARTEQHAVNRQLVEAKISAKTSNSHRDIVKWLAPHNHEASYFKDDLRSAYQSRHPGTCTWILDRPEFNVWMNSGPNDVIARMLWLTGIPGAGKTILSSFVINSCSEVSDEKRSPPTIYFFFKNTDVDKNSMLAATRSLVFQLYTLFPATLSPELISLRDDSGKEKALSEQSLWDLFVKHAKGLGSFTIVLDALDECNDVDSLLGHMILLLQCCHAKLFVVSRREENIALALGEYPRIVIGSEDIGADIRSYVTAEIERIPRFQGKPVQRRMINALASGHDGMFLWAYLMVRELRELGTVRQVDEALKALPTGLQEMHDAIISRLDSSLHRAHRELAVKILAWVVCAVRPLRLQELQEILRFETRQSGTVAQSLEDDDLLYSEKEIEMACGALVISRNETLQLIHLSTKEILMRRPPHLRFDDSRRAFYVEATLRNPHMGLLCVSYISTHLNGMESITRPNLDTVSRLEFSKENYDSTDLVTKSPFINYASISWQAHLIDGKISLELESVLHQLQKLLTYGLTLLWIELCVSLHQDIIWTVERSCKEIMSWADCALVPAETACHRAVGFLWAWSSAVVSIINEYGFVIEEHPCEIHYLDLANLLSYECAPGSAVLPASYVETEGQNPREQIIEVRAADLDQSSAKVEPCRQLQPNLQDPSETTLGFVIYDRVRNVYFSADYSMPNGTEVLRVQERATGRRLDPIRNPLNIDSGSFTPENSLSRFHLIKALLCRDCKYLAILYSDFVGYFVTSVWNIERQLNFLGIRDRRPWARRLHCFGSYNGLFVDSCLPLTVGLDGLFYCPSGQIHPEHGIQKQIPNYFVSFAKPYGKIVLAFAGNGQIIIKLDRSNRFIEGIPWLETTVVESWRLQKPTSNSRKEVSDLRAISQSGRFMVYETLLEDESSAVFYLLRYQGSPERLQADSTTRYFSMFYISRNEQSLLGITTTPQRLLTRFSRWAVTDPSFVPQAETNLLIPEFLPNYRPENVCVVEEDARMILANDDRVLFELDLNNFTFMENFGPPASSTHQPFCHSDYEISSNGCRLAHVYMRCTSDFQNEESKSRDFIETCLESVFVDLSGTAEQTQRLELRYTEPKLSASHIHSFTFSPDLSLLQAGPYIYDLAAPGLTPLSFSDSAFGKLGPRGTSRTSFSSCNKYLTILGRKDAAAEGEHVTFGIFRICRTAGRIEKIALDNREILAADLIAAAFHPMLPLLLLTYITYQEGDVSNDLEAIKVMEIDLQELKPVPIAIPKHKHVTPEELSEIDEACYSDCGSFCFLKFENGKVLILESNLLGKRRKMQTPAVWSNRTSYDGRFYSVAMRDEPPMLKVYQAIDHPCSGSYRDSAFIWRPPEETIAVKITALSSRLAFGMFHLLTGGNGDHLVRILFLPRNGPPAIKYLRVTLNQILAKLQEIAKIIEPNVQELLQEQLEEESEEESSVSESEEAVMSADEDADDHSPKTECD